MNDRIRLAFVALGFAIIIPISISVFLLNKSYELERKKFDFEVMSIVGDVFYSFQADYKLLDSLINQNFILSPKKQNNPDFDLYFENQLLKVYRNYKGINDSIQDKLMRNNYNIEFEYLLEISDLRITIGDWQDLYIADSIGSHKPLVLYGNLNDMKTAARYGFYFKGTGYNTKLVLYIDYPGRNSFLLQRIWTLIVSIVISMLILIFILLYTVKVLFWQKKISDMKSQFIDNITHEFNTPVSTLKIISANIKKLNSKINSKDLGQISVRIENQASRLSLLIDKVMSLSVNEKRNINYDYKVVGLNEFLRKLIEKFKQNNYDKIKSLELDLKAEPDEIIVDDYYFSIAILNVLDNAVKYSKQGAEIELSSVNSNNSICLSINDKGIGMKAFEKKQIFKRFYRAGFGNVFMSSGLGLGLCIVKQVMDTHKIEILVESKVGFGTEFKFIIPFKSDILIEKINKNLLESAKSGDIEAVIKAIENGANIDVTNSEGKMAMMLAVNEKQGYDIVMLLLEKGANALITDNMGKNLQDHLIMPEEPSSERENEYEAWIYSKEHFLNTYIWKAMEKQKNEQK